MSYVNFLKWSQKTVANAVRESARLNSAIWCVFFDGSYCNCDCRDDWYLASFCEYDLSEDSSMVGLVTMGVWILALTSISGSTMEPSSSIVENVTSKEPRVSGTAQNEGCLSSSA